MHTGSNKGLLVVQKYTLINRIFQKYIYYFKGLSSKSTTNSTLRSLFSHYLLTKRPGRNSISLYTLLQQCMKISKPVFRLSSVFTRQLLSQAAAVIDVPLCSVAMDQWFGFRASPHLRCVLQCRRSDNSRVINAPAKVLVADSKFKKLGMHPLGNHTYFNCYGRA